MRSRARQARNENPDDPLPSRPFSFLSSSIFNFHVFRLTLITMSYCCLPRGFSKEDQNLRIKPALADQGLLNPIHRISQSKMGFMCNMWRHGLSYKRLCFLFIERPRSELRPEAEHGVRIGTTVQVFLLKTSQFLASSLDKNSERDRISKL
jgi:hypothetical protein